MKFEFFNKEYIFPEPLFLKREDRIISKKEFTDDGNLSVKDQIDNFVNNLNFTCTTYRKKSGKHHFKPGRRRTTSDIIPLLDYYNNGKVTEEEIAQALYDLVAEGKICIWFCGTISQRVYLSPEAFWNRRRNYGTQEKDEHNKSLYEYNIQDRDTKIPNVVS